MSEFLLAAHDDELLSTTVEEPSLNNRRTCKQQSAGTEDWFTDRRVKFLPSGHLLSFIVQNIAK